MKNRSIAFMISLLGVFQAHSASHTVKTGENMYRIALHYKVSVAQLQAANPKARFDALRVGQSLAIPANASVSVASAKVSLTKPKVTATGSHQVADGETLSSIARSRGIAVADLQAMNPGINPSALRIGQSISVGGRPTAKPANTQVVSHTPRPQPKTEVVSQPAPQVTRKVHAPVETSMATTQMITANYTIPAPLPVIEPEVLPTAPPVPEQAPVTNAAPATIETPQVNPPSTPKNLPQESPKNSTELTLKMIKTTREMTLADFASEHGLTTDQLNTLNGWNFHPSTLLAVDSELNIPAQP
jgi:LysM repeat protein